MTSTDEKTTPVDAPDLVGDAGRAQHVLQVLRELQSKLVDLEVRTVADGASDDDPSGYTRDGEMLSVGDRRAQLEEAQQRLLVRYEALLPTVRALGGIA